MPAVVQRADHFEAGEHAEHAIEAPAGRYRVEMAAECDCRCCVVAALAAEEHVADRVLLEAQVQLVAPSQQQRAGFGVLGRERETATAAFRRRADAGDVHDGLPEAVGVDRDGHG